MAGRRRGVRLPKVSFVAFKTCRSRSAGDFALVEDEDFEPAGVFLADVGRLSDVLIKLAAFFRTLFDLPEWGVLTLALVLEWPRCCCDDLGCWLDELDVCVT